MRKWLWQDTLDNVGQYSSNLMPLHAIGSVLAIFAVCFVIDQLRICLLEKPFFKLFDKVSEKIKPKLLTIENKLLKIKTPIIHDRR